LELTAEEDGLDGVDAAVLEDGVAELTTDELDDFDAELTTDEEELESEVYLLMTGVDELTLDEVVITTLDLDEGVGLAVVSDSVQVVSMLTLEELTE
jgi:uncharacterized protein with ATP-grasp and redox domains